MVNFDDVVWYSRSRGAVESGPNVSLSKNGRVVLNHEALQMFDEVPEAFQVGIIQGSRGKVTLVLQAAAKGDAGSLAVTKQGRTKVSLNTSRFLKEQGLEKLFGSASTKPDMDNEFGALIAQM